MPNLTFLTSDNMSITIDYEKIKSSYLIRNMIEWLGFTHEVLPLDVDYDTMQLILRWTVHHKDDPIVPENFEDKERNMHNIPDWDKKYFQMMNQCDLFKVINAANYFRIPKLLEYSYKTVALIVSGKTPEELRDTFGITNEVNSEESLDDEMEVDDEMEEDDEMEVDILGEVDYKKLVDNLEVNYEKLIDNLGEVDDEKLTDNSGEIDYGKSIDNSREVNHKKLIDNLGEVDYEELIDNDNEKRRHLKDAKLIDNLGEVDDEKLIDNSGEVDCEKLVDNSGEVNHKKLIDNSGEVDYEELIDNDNEKRRQLTDAKLLCEKRKIKTTDVSKEEKTRNKKKNTSKTKRRRKA